MILPSLAICVGLLLLVWSADRFVEGAAATAKYAGMSPLLIGMIIIGFGTSAPEMMVSALSAAGGNPGLAFGNAYGSNIANIGLILGVTAMICPIAAQSVVVRKEIPILLGVTGLSTAILVDGDLTRLDAVILLGAFAMLMGWTIFEASRNRDDALGQEVGETLGEKGTHLKRALVWVVVGLLLLIASSRVLVWGAVEIAVGLGVSDLVIGLTIVAVGTSLPELAASLSAARKGKPDLALGNILGSNLFNTLVVVGIVGMIGSTPVPQEIVNRDLPVVGLMTLGLLIVCYGRRGRGIVNRFEGAVLLSAFVGYTVWLVAGSS